MIRSTSRWTTRTPNTLDVAFRIANQAAGIEKRFTIHGLRYTFTDLVRHANVDAVVRRALTGHVTEEMQRHHSTVGIDEKRAAIAGVPRLVPPSAPQPNENAGGTSGGTNEGRTAATTEKAAKVDDGSAQKWTAGGTKRENGRFWSRPYYPGAFARFRRAGYRIRTGDLQLGNLRLFLAAGLTWSDHS